MYRNTGSVVTSTNLSKTCLCVKLPPYTKLEEKVRVEVFLFKFSSVILINL